MSQSLGYLGLAALIVIVAVCVLVAALALRDVARSNQRKFRDAFPEWRDLDSARDVTGRVPFNPKRWE